MNIKHIWSVLCKESVVNQDDNLISIHGVLEELNVDIEPLPNTDKMPEKIAVPLNYEIVSLWMKEKEDALVKADLEFLLLSPGGIELSKMTHKMEIPIHIRRYRTRMKISGLPVVNEGDYAFEIKIKEEGEENFNLVSKLPLAVHVNLISPKK